MARSDHIDRWRTLGDLSPAGALGAVAAFGQYLVRDLQQAYQGNQSEAADHVAERRKGKQSQPVGVAERGAPTCSAAKQIRDATIAWFTLPAPHPARSP
jgi:hypothetical protein